MKGSIVFPGSVGGVNWGGAAYDPQRHLLVMDTNHLAILVRLIPREKYDEDIKASTTNDRLHGEWGRQTGAPYAMFRTPLIGPSETLTLCSPPPWGHDGQLYSRVRCGVRKGDLEVRVAGWRAGYAYDLRVER